MAVLHRRMASALWMAVISSGLAVGLSGCGAAMNPGSISLFKDTSSDQKAIEALGRGDLVRAEAFGNQALKDNPQNPVAILALAIVYQHTNRLEGARQYYQLVISMHADDLIPSMSGGEPKTVDEIARHNLAVMTGVQDPQVSLGQVMAQQAYDDDAAVIRRFKALHYLLDQDLITREEYDQRRKANLGALLQYTAPQAPAFGITSPAPEGREIVDRLKAISANYQEQSISAEEQTLERNIILEALMPAHPDRRADRAPPVTDELQYSAKVGRLQHLQEAGVVTKAEADKERKAIDAQLSQARAMKEAQARAAAEAARAAEAAANGEGAAAPVPLAPPAAMAPTGTMGLQLGTYGSKKGAERAWSTLQGQYPAELGGLTPHISREVVNKRRGIARYRLSAGPVADQETAEKSCRALKLFDLTCSPVKLK
jgi:hypothetical protein